MKNYIRKMVLLLFVVSIFVLFPQIFRVQCESFAEEYEGDHREKIEYRVENEEITITKMSSNSEAEEGGKIIEICSEINGLPVTRIASNSVSEDSEVDKLIIPSSVTEIAEDAFAHRKIKTIEIEYGIKTIGERSF